MNKKSLSCVIGLALLLFSTTRAHADGKPARALFLSSYAESFMTVPEQLKGINEVFLPNGVAVDVEYMDTKRLGDAESVKKFRDYLAYKLSRVPRYDVILAGDDAATQLVMDERKTLFAGIPIVFFCVNDVDRAREAIQDPLMTGIVEGVSPADTISLALSFNPDATRVAAIVDGTPTGIGDRKQFLDLRQLFPSLSFEVFDSSNETFEQMGKRVAELGNESILIYLSMFEDSTGATMTIDEAVRFLVGSAKVPVYRVSIGGVGQGLIGGVMVSYSDQGKTAAGMAMRILAGAPPAMVKPLLESPNRVMLDEKVLKRFGIPLSKVPDNSIVLNHETNFLERNKNILVGTGIIIAFLLALVSVVAVDNLKLRKIEKQLQKSERRFREMALRDALTGLCNRTGLQEWVEDRMEGFIHGTGAFIYLDLDNFKDINDAFGHNTGDEVLRIVGSRFKQLELRNRCVSRIGGDEFVIAMWDENIEARTAELMGRIKERLRSPCSINGRTFFLNASYGVAYYPQHGTNYTELLQNVDAAMYQAKTTGKNRHIVFSQDIRQRLHEQITIQEDLRAAIENREFELHYQPQVSLESGKTIGYEALIRWNHPKKGLLAPDAFIKIAEDSGMIADIGEIVLESACEFLRFLLGERGSRVKVSVNVSVIQLRQADFVPKVLDIYRKYDLPAGTLMLELTESALMFDFATSAAQLEILRSAGIPICLDDFGTGYSSLNYIRELPIDILKIDRSFIVDVSDSDGSRNLSEDIIRIAHKLNMTVIAEGIETEEQRDRLKELDCDIIQGYLTGRPLPAGKLRERESD